MTGADGYQILVDNDPNFTSPEINAFPVSSDYTPTFELAENVLYYWKVRARNTVTGDSSDWSATWSFRVDITPPTAPSLVSPENAATLYVDQPVFTWTPVSDLSGVSYKLEIDNDPDFSSPTYSILLASTSHQIENKLTENFSPYYWRVTAIDGAQNKNSSAIYTFRLKVPPSSFIDPISPYWQNQNFTLTVTASDNDGVVENVEFWYRYSSDNVNWGSWILYENDSTPPYSWVFVPPSGVGFYEFYSRAWDDRGNYENAPEQADARCGFDNVAPPAVENLLPENNAEVTSFTPTLEWARVTDLSGVSYQVLVDNEDTFSPPYVFQADNLTDNWVTTSTLVPGVEYFWKVRAADGAGNSSWSAVYQFNVRTWWYLESVNGGALTAGSWAPAEGWQARVLGEAGWVETESWTAGLAPFWFSLDSCSGWVQTSAQWNLMEGWEDSCSVPVSWSTLEWMSGEITSLMQWVELETIGNWIASAGTWRVVEGLGASCRTLESDWRLIDELFGVARGTVGWSWLDFLAGCVRTSAWWSGVDGLLAGIGTVAQWWLSESFSCSIRFPADWDLLCSWTATSAALVLPPNLVAPENSSNLSTNFPTLNWENTLPADNWQLQVDNDADFTSPEVDIWTTSTSYQPTLPDGKYYWRVRQMRSGVFSEWSLVWSFRLDTIPPGVPLLVYPVNLNINDNRPLFRWSSVPENSLPLSYWLEIDNEPAFNEPILLSVGWLWDNSYRLENVLSDGLYYWRVKVRDNAGNLSSWSATENFRVDTIRPAPPTPVSPVGFAWAPITPTLRWQKVTENSLPVLYQVYICESSTFDASLYQVYCSPWLTENEWTAPPLLEGSGLEGKIFYWRVCARDNAGNLSDNSPSQSFQTDDLPPSTPTILSPENSSFVSTTLTLFYSASDNGSGVGSYWVQIFDANRNLILENTVAENRLTVQLSTGVYWWRVRARDAVGNLSGWTDNYTFQVCDWRELEGWRGVASTRTDWSRVEGWAFTACSSFQWLSIECLTGTIRTLPFWTSLDGWNGTISSVFRWSEVERWGGQIGGPVWWQPLDFLSATVRPAPSWVQVEAWVLTLRIPGGWFWIESLAGTIRVPTGWLEVDGWGEMVQAQASWAQAEGWVVMISAPTGWFWIESWAESIRAPTGWFKVDEWGGTVQAQAAWARVEGWIATISVPIGWRSLEGWLNSVASVPPKWLKIEEWSDRISTRGQWLALETSAGAVQVPTGWLGLESWIAGSVFPAAWQIAEGWTVEAWAAAGWMVIDSRAATSQAPVPAPLLLTPLNWENTSSTTPTFTWENTLPADNFDLQIDDDADFSPPIVISVSVTSTSYTPSSPLQDNLYYWRVRQWRAGSSSTWSVRVFRVDTVPPAPLVPVSPREAENDNYTPTLRWAPPSENSLPLVYRVQIATSPSFFDWSIRLDTDWTVTESALTPPVLEDNLYYWRVAAKDNAGNSGFFSPTRSFRVDTLPPAAPTLLTPENGASVEKVPILSWVSVPENSLPVLYFIQVAQTADFTVGRIESGWIVENSWICPPLEETVWYWRVRARDNAGNYSPWTETRWFLVSPGWRALESWVCPVRSSASWRANELWAGVISAPVAWRPTDFWIGSVDAPAVWRLVDSWIGTGRGAAMWQDLEGWVANIRASATWSAVEGWTGAARSLVAWSGVETWVATVSSPAVWRLLEKWAGTIQARALWYLTEGWAGIVQAPAGWHLTGQLSAGVGAPSRWMGIEAWACGCNSPSAWRFAEGWLCGLQSPSNWAALEGFQARVLGWVEWRELEGSSSVLGAPARWLMEDALSATIQGPAVWRVQESWFGTIGWPTAWIRLEQLAANLRTHVIWSQCEQWSGASAAVPSWWRVVEGWQEISPAISWWRSLEALLSHVSAVTFWSPLESWAGAIGAPIYPPLLLSPENAFNSNDNTPTFSWENLQPVDAFELQVDNNPDFSSPEVSVVIAENSYTPSALQDNLYYWRVRCRRAGAFSPWSGVRTLRIDTVPPIAPTLVSPEDGRDINDSTPLLRWTRPFENSLPLTYNLRISTSSYFEPENIVANVWVADNAYEVYGLQENIVYYWKVCAKDNAGNVGLFQESAWKFKIDTISPAAPILTSPENAGWAAPAAVLRWQPVAENSPPVLYRVEISDFPDFLNFVRVIETYDTSWTVNPPLPVSSYYWRVRARDNALNWGAWSLTYWFKVDNDPPSALLLSPENEVHVQANSSFTLYFTGNDGTGSGVAGYTLQISTDPFFSTIVVEVTVSENSFSTTLPRGTYYWRVRAIDRVGNVGAWSVPRVLYASDWTWLESWSLSVLGAASWLKTDTWTPSVWGKANWHSVEVLQGGIENIAAGWFYLDELTGGGIGVHYWARLEEFSTEVRGGAFWFSLETTGFSMAVPPSFWYLQEEWHGGWGTKAEFIKIEGLSSHLCTVAEWMEVENWEATSTGVHYWAILESFEAGVCNRQWRSIEGWVLQVKSPASFGPLEGYLATVGVFPSRWHFCERWSEGSKGKMGEWTRLDTVWSRSRPAAWTCLDRVESRLSVITGWWNLEERGGTLESPVLGYILLEQKSGGVSAPHIWVRLVVFEGGVSSPIFWKIAVESSYVPKFVWFKLDELGGFAWAPRWIERRTEEKAPVPVPTEVELSDLSPSLEKVKAKIFPPGFKVSVGESRYLPPWLPRPESEVYTYFDLLLENAQPLVLRVRIDKGWLKQMSRNTLKVLGYRGSWKELPFEEVAEDAEFLYLELRPGDFKCFAIVARKPPYFPIWTVFWIWLGVVGALCCVIIYPHLSELRTRSLERKYERALKGVLYKKVGGRLRTLAKRLSRDEKKLLRSLVEELEAVPPRLVPVEEKLTVPELVAVKTLERFIRERRKKIPLRKEKVEELRRLQEEMLKRKRR